MIRRRSCDNCPQASLTSCKVLPKSEQVDSRATPENRLCVSLKSVEVPTTTYVWTKDEGDQFLISTFFSQIDPLQITSKWNVMYRQTEMQSCTTAVTYCCHDCHLRPRTTVWHLYGLLSYAVLLFYSAVMTHKNMCCVGQHTVHTWHNFSTVWPIVILYPTLWCKDPNLNQNLLLYFTQYSRYTPWPKWKNCLKW